MGKVKPPRLSLEMHEAHFPDSAPIEAYGNGGFRFADMSHQGSLLCLPDGIFRWDVTCLDDIKEQAFERVFENPSDVFLLGLGFDFQPLPKYIKELFSKNSIMVEGMSTGAAIRTYNVLLSERRSVSCGLIAV